MSYYCSEHPTKSAVFFCDNDQSMYCESCIKNHNGHNLMSIGEHLAIKHTQLKSEYAQICCRVNVLAHIKKEINTAINNLLLEHAKSIKQLQLTITGDCKADSHIPDSMLHEANQFISDFIESLKQMPNKEQKHKQNADLFIHSWKENQLTLYYPNSISKSIIMLNAKINCLAESIALKDRIFIIGGYSNGNALDSTYEININEASLTTKAPILQIKCSHSLCAYQNCIYSSGGFSIPKSLADCEKYIVNSNEWLKLPDLLTPRRACASFVLNNKLYVFGGNNFYNSCSHFLNSIESLQLSELENWVSVKIKSPPHPRSSVAAVCIGECAIIFGG